MVKIKETLSRYRHPLTMLAILLTAVVVLGTVARLTLPQAAEKTERVIVNDDYTTLTAEITGSEGIKQDIVVKGGTEFYGLSLNFHIFNRVQHGTVFVDVEDAAGNIVASSSRDLTTLLDNTFKGFIFDKMLYSEKDEHYTVHVYTAPETSEDRIALWKSEKNYDHFTLYENSVQTDGAVALQYYTAYVGSDIYGFFALLSFIAIAGLEIVYLLVFVKKCRHETAFATIALTLGIIFSLFTPICGGPDEYVHVASCYKISNQWLGIENNAPKGHILVRECDAVMALNDTVDYNPFRFQDMYRGLAEGCGGRTEMTVVSARTADMFLPVYLPQTIGITLARVLGMGFVQLILMGRLFNLLFYVAVVYIAVKKMPVFKTTLAVCGLLPMCMQLAGNFSYDTYILAMSFLFTGLVFNLAYGKKTIGIKDLVIPTIVLCMLTPVKAIYLTLALLVFILPSAAFATKRKGMAAKALIFLLAFVFWADANLGSAFHTLDTRTDKSGDKLLQTIQQAEENKTAENTDSNGTAAETADLTLYPFDVYLMENPVEEAPVFWDPESDILPNGDSKHYYSVPYILKNIKQTVKLVLNTITTKSGHILQCMIGTRLGEIIVVDLQASWIWFIAILLIMLLSVLDVKGSRTPYNGVAKWWNMLIFLGTTALAVVVCIMWTPVNYVTIFGLQGRYLLPALPLAVMFFSNRWITLEKNIDSILLYSMLPVNILVILNVFMIMAGR